MYTGGGLAVTALAARSMFKAGLPLRMMAANPCELPPLDEEGVDVLMLMFVARCRARPRCWFSGLYW